MKNNNKEERMGMLKKMFEINPDALLEAAILTGYQKAIKHMFVFLLIVGLGILIVKTM